MDAVYYLKKRTGFIRFYYEESAKPFGDIQLKIDRGLSPYDDPPWSDDGEPPFLEEWGDAKTGIDILGHSCVSLLSDTLKLYFQTLQKRVIGFGLSREEESIANQHGFVAAYKAALGYVLDTDWTDCPARFDVIEQVVLARNRSQHGGDLRSFEVSHDGKTLKKHPRPFFASEVEWKTWKDNGGDVDSFFAPTIEITRENLFAAIQETEALADWIEGRMEKAWEWRRNAASE
jgi:hypothetical protein